MKTRPPHFLETSERARLSRPLSSALHRFAMDALLRLQQSASITHLRSDDTGLSGVRKYVFMPAHARAAQSISASEMCEVAGSKSSLTRTLQSRAACANAHCAYLPHHVCNQLHHESVAACPAHRSTLVHCTMLCASPKATNTRTRTTMQSSSLRYNRTPAPAQYCATS